MIGSLLTKRKLALAGMGTAISLTALACGADNSPAAEADNDANPATTPPPAEGMLQSGYDAVRQSLQADGAVIVRLDEADSGIFQNPYVEVLVNGEKVEVYEFESEADALEASLTVSSDGTLISHGDTPPIAIDFQNSPHYYLQGKVIVVYTGADGEVVELLRSRLGDEFAGDTGAGMAPTQPDYETVEAPAPIDGVKVVADPNNPGRYILYVKSGLPGGCASFEGWSLDKTKDNNFDLEVTNIVPAPEELIACTMIYGMVDSVVPVGTVGEDLTACEVYTVSFRVGNDDKIESVKFQAIADNVRCADPGLDEGDDSYGVTEEPGREPGEAGEGEFPQTIISDVQALLAALERLGVKAEWGTGDEKGSSLLGFDSDIIMINGQRVDVWVFDPGSSAWKAAGGISQDGYEIAVPGAPATMVSWISSPHFYLFGNTIVLYVGVDEEVISALDDAAVKFAGPDSKPLDQPIPVEPDGGIGDGAGMPTPGDRPIPVEPDGGIGDGAGAPSYDPDQAQGEDPLPFPDLEVVEKLAPIVGVGDVVVAESFPPQYFITVRSAQSDGCAQDAGYEVSVDGTEVNINVYNTVPAHPEVVLCLMIYGETEHNINLGSDFESGVEYTIVVNGEEQGTFVGA